MKGKQYGLLIKSYERDTKGSNPSYLYIII